MPNHAAYLQARYFPNLDGLRFICISMVLWHHAQPVPSGVFQLADRGFLGVDFFFVLSGYLITTLLLREADRDGKFSLRNFYIRRIIRIVPVYFFVVTSVASYYGLVKGQPVGHLLPYYYLFLSNFLYEHIPTLTITWSLSVEEQFYMLWPAALLLVPHRFLPTALVGVIAINVLVGAGILNIVGPHVGPLRIALPTATYAPILMGALAAMLLHKPNTFGALARLLGGRLAISLSLVALIMIIALTPADVNGWPNLAIHLAMTVTVIAMVLRTDGAISTMLQNPLIRRIGVVSYGIYLYHLIGLDITMRVFGRIGFENEWAVLFAYSVVSYLIAEISFRTLEAYFRRFRPKS